MSDSSRNTELRRIPSMERLLSDPALEMLVSEWGRTALKEALREAIDEFRANGEVEPVTAENLASVVGPRLGMTMQSTLRPVINGSGVIIHTNLGRSPVSSAGWTRAGRVVDSYSNLEFDLAAGGRGKRHLHLSDLASKLFGCESALLVNNNAAAVLLVCAAIARGKEVIVSRGELVEIGGSFRVPDVIEQGGAKLREVGTTNRTRASDYEDAIGRRTGAMLQVHRSNFQIVGFTETPRIESLVDVAKRKRKPLVIDEGSGRVVDLNTYGFRSEPTVRELLELGADVVTCSTDKLLGSVQGGLILGSREILGKCAAHPLMRAFRPGKESFALIGETLSTFLKGAHEQEVPIYRMLAAKIDDLRHRAETIAGESVARVVTTETALGGGTTPEETIPSVGLQIPGEPDAIQRQLLDRELPVVGRIINDRFVVDLRTVLAEDDGALAMVVREVAS